MRPFHQRERHSLSADARRENTVGHFDGFEGTFSRGKRFSLLTNGIEPVSHYTPMRRIVSSESFKGGLCGRINTAIPCLPVFDTRRGHTIRIEKERKTWSKTGFQPHDTLGADDLHTEGPRDSLKTDTAAECDVHTRLHRKMGKDVITHYRPHFVGS